MPIVGIAFMALFLVMLGATVGGALGTGGAWFLYLRTVRQRECEGAVIVPEEEFSAGCGALLTGSILGSVLGGGAVLVVGYWAGI